MYSSLKSVELLKQRIYWMHSSPIYQILQRSGRDQLPCAFVQCRAGPCRLPSQPAMMQWYEYHPSDEGVAAARQSCLDASKFVDVGNTASWNLLESSGIFQIPEQTIAWLEVSPLDELNGWLSQHLLLESSGIFWKVSDWEFYERLFPSPSSPSCLCFKKRSVPSPTEDKPSPTEDKKILRRTRRRRCHPRRKRPRKRAWAPMLCVQCKAYMYCCLKGTLERNKVGASWIEFVLHLKFLLQHNPQSPSHKASISTYVEKRNVVCSCTDFFCFVALCQCVRLCLLLSAMEVHSAFLSFLWPMMAGGAALGLRAAPRHDAVRVSLPLLP